jgi:hypothetical protein
LCSIAGTGAIPVWPAAGLEKLDLVWRLGRTEAFVWQVEHGLVEGAGVAAGGVCVVGEEGDGRAFVVVVKDGQEFVPRR